MQHIKNQEILEEVVNEGDPCGNLILALGSARRKLIPPDMLNPKLGEDKVDWALGRQMLQEIARRFNGLKAADFSHLKELLESNSDFHQECQGLLQRLEAGEFTIYI